MAIFQSPLTSSARRTLSRHVGRSHLAQRHPRNRLVGRDRACRRAAVDRRHGGGAPEI